MKPGKQQLQPLIGKSALVHTQPKSLSSKAELAWLVQGDKGLHYILLLSAVKTTLAVPSRTTTNAVFPHKYF